jgi:hypothetical protein
MVKKWVEDGYRYAPDPVANAEAIYKFHKGPEGSIESGALGDGEGDGKGEKSKKT